MTSIAEVSGRICPETVIHTNCTMYMQIREKQRTEPEVTADQKFTVCLINVVIIIIIIIIMN